MYPGKTHIIAILCTIVYCQLLSVNAQTISFEVNTQTGCSPLQVNFRNNSSPGINAQYKWILGNGNYSGSFEPYAVYTKPGKYDVSLIMTYQGKTDTLTREAIVSVYKNPEADFELAGAASGCAPFLTSFTNKTRTGDAAIKHTKWDFGDGNIDTTGLNTHTYQFAGLFNISLVITDENGCRSSKTIENLIETFKPIASFNASQAYSCNGSLATQFTNQSSGQGNLNYVWSFGDGQQSADNSPAHLYALPGKYDVSLIANDTHGCSNQLVKPKLIEIIKVAANFDASVDTGCINQNIVFTNKSLNATDFTWNFGDHSISALKDASHKFGNYGNFKVTLKVSKKGECTDSVSKTINIEQVKADFKTEETYSCQLPFVARYQNLSVNASSFQWKTGKGKVSTSANPADTISALPPSVFIFSPRDTLIAISPHGCRDIAVKDSLYKIILPVADFSPSSVGELGLSGCIPLTSNFVDKSKYTSTKDQISQWKWTFGDNTSANTANATHVFDKTGIFNVKLQITTSLGCTAEKSAVASAGTKQTAMFSTLSPQNICASDTIKFINSSSDALLINSYNWDFGDGTTSTNGNPSHVFQKAGYVNVKLTAGHNGCTSIFTKDSLFFVKGPVISFNTQFDCKKPLEYIFNGNISGAELYSWNFGDNSASVNNQNNIGHAYPNSGNYVVKLTASNATTGCAVSTRKTVNARNVKAKFSTDKAVYCPGDEVMFNGEASEDESQFNWNGRSSIYLWYFESEKLNIFSKETVSHKFPKKGNYRVKLIVKDQNSCADTLTSVVRVFQPEVDFKADYTEGCIPAVFKFTNLTKADTSIVSCLWKFNNAATSAEFNPSFGFQSFGQFPVSLTVTDKVGCSASLLKNDYVKVVKPDANFTVTDSTICIGNQVQFRDVSESNIRQYLWNFGAGKTSADAMPLVTYADTGKYDVKLQITDEHGCVAQSGKPAMMKVQKPPLVNFQAYPLAFNCYPSQVSFIDQSVSPNLSTWFWRFGDNLTASELKSPSHIYTKPGRYNVTLFSSTSYGCTDSLTKPLYIEVSGPWAKIIAADTACRNIPTQLVVGEQLNVNGFKWDLGNGLSATTDTVIPVYPNFGTVYPSLILYSDSIHTCDKVIVDSVHILKVVAGFSSDNGWKGCTPFDLVAKSTSSNAQNYIWSINGAISGRTPELSQKLSIPNNYKVKLKVVGKFACADSLEKQIPVYPLPVVKISEDTLICRGSTINLVASGGIHYAWSPQKWISGYNSAKPVVTPDSAIRYKVLVSDINDCENSGSLFVNVQQVPHLVLKDTAIIIGEKVRLNVARADISKYVWSPEMYITCRDCPSPEFLPLQSTDYTLTVTDTSNCFHVPIPFKIEILRKYSVDVPNLFTPNNDGHNDKLFVKGWGIEDLLEFRIFNRFGEMVFETSDLQTGWDGTYHGIAQNAETFSYIVRVKTYDGDILTKKGFIKLIR